MDAERWGRVDQLLQSALLVSPERRDEFLCRECAGDPALEGEVRSPSTHTATPKVFSNSPQFELQRKPWLRPTPATQSIPCAAGTSHTIKSRKNWAPAAWARSIAPGTPALTVKSQSRPFRWSLSQPDAISRFEKEARSACALNHPNIVTIYELGQVNGTHYIAMELVDGETVREMLASGPIPFRKAVAIASQIADALAKAHEIGIVHRDLKPENLMVTRDGVCQGAGFRTGETP